MEHESSIKQQNILSYAVSKQMQNKVFPSPNMLSFFVCVHRSNPHYLFLFGLLFLLWKIFFFLFSPHSAQVRYPFSATLEPQGSYPHLGHIQFLC